MIQVVGLLGNQVHQLMYSVLRAKADRYGIRLDFVESPSGKQSILFFRYNAGSLTRHTKKRGIKTYAVQPGLFREPYDIKLPSFHKYFTFGKYYTGLLKTHNSHLKCVEVGSLKVDYLRELVTFPSPHVVLIDQPFNTKKGNVYPGFEWDSYTHNVKTWCDEMGLEMYIMPHYTRPTFQIRNIACTRSFRILATSCCVITVYSTLALECAAAGIPVLSYVPVPNRRVLNFSRYGVKVVKTLKGVEPPDASTLSPSLVTRTNAADKILEEIKKDE